MKNPSRILFWTCLFLFGAIPSSPASVPEVTWSTPGHDSQDSMPLGNGDIGLNVWTEPNGDILFYLGKTDAWAESASGELVKLGLVRISLSPSPFAGGGDFQQTLRPQSGEIVVSGGGARFRVWVDANAPVVRVEVDAPQPLSAKVTLEPWRTEPKGKISPDVVVPDEPAGIRWYHRNAGTGLPPALVDRTFGGALFGADLKRTDLRTLETPAPARQIRFSIVALTTPSGPLADWSKQLADMVATERAVDWAAAWTAHAAWWQAFWDRSHIVVTGNPAADGVTLGYALQRFVTACAGRGAYPVKFNGSIFVTDNPGNTRREKGNPNPIPDPFDADTRAWGGQYWFQNTRPMYWPRLAAGDYDLMAPLFRMYGGIIKSNAPFVKEYYGHDGSCFAETAPFFGGIPKIKPDAKGSYTLHYFTPVLELTAMMLDYYAHTGDKAFARESLVPMATEGLRFFSAHFPRDAQGKLLLDPDNAIEMYWKVKNPLPDIAGLHWVLDQLLALPSDLVDGSTRKQWETLQAELPPIPVGERDGRKILLPYAADQPPAPGHNSENPELYAVYPFRIYGIGKPDLDVALDTYAARLNKRTGCWHQDPVQEAYLGLTAQAQKDVTANLTKREPRLRFPAFWEKGHDYAPDQDNGGHGELALQRMILQEDGKKILLLPAWPTDWNVDFKLHAAFQTVVSGRVEGGKLVQLDVTPAARKADVTVKAPYTAP